MIDLSHLTEEEQGAIMAVLRRDLELKKAEEDRISKLEKVLNSGSQSDTQLKYLTGEWFYEAKSRRHMDKIHGSDIILASMRQKRAGSDAPLRSERSNTMSSRGSDVVPPPKPARFLEALQPQEINDAEKENLNAGVCSPRMPRQNPFNRASLIIAEPPESSNEMATSQDQESPSPETDSKPPPKSHPAGEASQAPGSSITSEASSAGFRPVPKRRTFISRRSSGQSGTSGLGVDAQVVSARVVPAPRRSLQRGSSGSSVQSSLKGQDEMPQKNEVSHQVSQSAQPSKSLVENAQLPVHDVSQTSSSSSLERERKEINPPSLTRDRPATYTRSDESTDKDNPWRRDERVDDTLILHTGSIQDSDREHSVGAAVRQEELSLPQSTVEPDPPVSYDLIFIDKSDPQAQKSNQKQMFKLSTQTTSPTDDEDSIAKVLDWFSRSTNSIDWQNAENVPGATRSSEKLSKIGKLRDGDLLGKDAVDIISNRKMETLEMKRSRIQKQPDEAEEFRATDKTGNKEMTKTQEKRKDTSERLQSQESEDNNEIKPPQMAHLRSFWEKSNMGPKILISKSLPSSNTEQKPAQSSVEKDKERANRSHGVSDMPSVSGIYNGKGSYEDERQQQMVPGSQTDPREGIHLNSNQDVYCLPMNASTQKSSDYFKFAASPHVVDRRDSDTEILSVTRLSPPPRTPIQSRLSPETESVPVVKPDPQPDSISLFQGTALQDELSKTVPVSLMNKDLQTRGSPDSEKGYLSRNSPYMDYKQGGNDVHIITKTQVRRGSSEDAKSRDNEDKSVQSSTLPKRKGENLSNTDRVSSPHTNRQGFPHQESTAERIKQLKLFWEQERNKPTFYTGKPKAVGDDKVAYGANQAKLNKRFTKSEYDLRSVGNYSGSDEEDHQNNTVSLNQRTEKSSPSIGTSRRQFNTLREFWGEATSDTKGSLSSDKPKSPKRKEPVGGQLPSQELECGDPEIYQEKTRPAGLKSSPPLQNRSKSSHDRQNNSKNNPSNYTTAEQQRETKRSLKESNREEKSSKPQGVQGKDRPLKSRKDSFSNSSSRGNSMRRTTSMFALSYPDEKDPSQLKTDVNPFHPQSRKQRQKGDRGGISRRSSEESETLTPRARACVPRDYRHYLGMTDKTSVHTSLAPAPEDVGSEGKPGYGYDLGGPVSASTPFSSEERYGRKGSKTSQRPLWTNYSSSDTGHESSLSSTSETWSYSRNRDNDDESQNPVRKALRRAEARPKNLAKSMEDITASLSPRQDRRPDPNDDTRHISDVSSIPSSSLSSFSDPDHLKKMSKSVPSFLEKEDVSRDSDSTGEDTYPRGRLTMGSSLTNLSRSPGLASTPSLSGSVMTMYSGDFGNVEVQGSIQFSINYIQKLREFHIFVAECRDLAAVDPKRGRSYPYVKSYLVPDKANLGKRKTSVKKKTLNPTFNEILRYRVRMEYLKTQTLILSVWHHDTFGRNSFLGEVDVDLSNWDFDHTQMNYLALKARTTPTLTLSNVRGEMRLAVRFLPSIIHHDGFPQEGQNTGEIHIWVKECKNLPLIRATIDPYVKCFVLPDRSRKSRQKTRVLRRTEDPVFNHTMVYDGIREADLSEACVELTVWDRDRLASNLLGGLRLGPGTGRSYGAAVDWMDSTPYEVALWDRMKATPNEWVEDVLPLRMLISTKTTFK